VFYEFLESIELKKGEPSSVNNKELSPTNSINNRELPPTMDFERKGLPTSTNTEKVEPSIPKEELVTLSTLIITSQLKKKKEQVMRLKSEIQELQVLERFIKIENQSLREHSTKVMDENDSLKEENEQLKKENALLTKQAYKWYKQKKNLKLQNQSLQVKVLMRKPRRKIKKKLQTKEMSFPEQKIEFKQGNHQFWQNFERQGFQPVVISWYQIHFLTSKPIHLFSTCGTYTSILARDIS
jgi:hypothetical protein